MRRAALALCFAAGVASAPAAARTVLGAGALSCARWADDRRSEAYVPSAQWVLGYLSRGDRERSHDRLSQVKAIQVVGWLDRYCAGHHAAVLERAAVALEGDLASGKPLPAPPRPKASSRSKSGRSRSKTKADDVRVEDVS